MFGVTSSGYQGSPKTQETQRQLVLGDTGPTAGLNPQREMSLIES